MSLVARPPSVPGAAAGPPSPGPRGVTPGARLPAEAGIGLRFGHYREVLAEGPPLRWVEVHSENFFDGGAAPAMLRRVAAAYPLSLHGVGLGLGSSARPDRGHLRSLRRLVSAVEPAVVSEHLCFNRGVGRQVNDLLPVPYVLAAVPAIAANVAEAQDAVGHRLLIENISRYVSFPAEDMNEGDFLAELVRRTGCGILLDVNNLYVNQVNLGTDVEAVLAALPPEAIGEIHLAGHLEMDGCLVDTHSRPVAEEVWSLYEAVLQRFGPRPTLIEWDADLPALGVLLGEAEKAQRLLDASTPRAPGGAA